MGILQFMGRILLAIALIAGSCGDLLPGSEGMACAAPMPTSDADEEAGDASGLGQESLEPVLISELDTTLLIPLQSHLLRNLSPLVPTSVVIRTIPHVPKPSFSL